jgi:hypothetical protein
MPATPLGVFEQIAVAANAAVVDNSPQRNLRSSSSCLLAQQLRNRERAKIRVCLSRKIDCSNETLYTAALHRT